MYIYYKQTLLISLYESSTLTATLGKSQFSLSFNIVKQIHFRQFRDICFVSFPVGKGNTPFD